MANEAIRLGRLAVRIARTRKQEYDYSLIAKITDFGIAIKNEELQCRLLKACAMLFYGQSLRKR
jgi:hypothetical protein